MIDESRLTNWYNLLKDMMELSGSAEWSSMLPSAEVVDAAPADLPAGYIRVVGKSGTYEPALKIPGAAYTAGDKVILLYIRGTEAIALAQAPGSSGGGGSGWPYSHVLTVDPTDTHADHPTLTLACAAAASGDTILFGASTYTENFTVPEGVAVVGVDVDECSIVGTVTLSDGSRLATCNVYQSTDDGTDAVAITTVAGAEVELFAVKATAYVGSAGGAARPFRNNGIAHVRCCWFTADGDATTDEDLILDADTYLTENNGDYNEGGQTYFLVGTTPLVKKNRATVRVSLAGIGTAITAASLFLYNQSGSNFTFDINVYRILVGNTGWVEGSSVNASEVGAVCWNKRVYNTNNWAGSVGCGTSGTDFAATRLGFKNRNWSGSTQWNEFVLDAVEIEKMRNGTYSNDGMVIISGSEGTAYCNVQFRSKEYADAAYHPYLRVTYGITPTLQAIYTDTGCTTYLHNLPTLVGTLAGAGDVIGWYADDELKLCNTDAAKGSLLVGSATGGPMELLTVGANGTVLTADSTVANGVKWA